MKSLILTILISLIFPFGYLSFGKVLDFQEEKSHKSHKSRKYEDLPEKEEFRQNYRLQPGAKVDITDISGALEIETVEGDTAEVYIVRSARDRKDLEYEKIKVENTSNSLYIHTTNNESYAGRRGHYETRQRVLLKLPKQINLSLTDISGFANVGEIVGALKVTDISGSINISKATRFTEIQDISGSIRIGAVVDCEQISDISGHVEIGVEKISSNGLKIHDISGNVNLKFAENVNADLTVRDVSGNVSVSSLDLTITRKYSRDNFDGKIGSGGTPVKISDISGSVKLTRQSLN